MERVSEYMIEPFYCTKDTRVSEIMHLLKKYDYEEILVIDSVTEEHPIGIVSLADIDDLNLSERQLPFDTSALECMRKLEAVVEEHSSINECLTIMSSHIIENIPVVDLDGKLKGMISKRDMNQRFIQ